MVTIGEHWAYRAKKGHPLVEVIVLELGTEPRRKRAKLEFVDDSVDSVPGWFPVQRLKCPWSEREEWEADERAWETVSRTRRRWASTEAYATLKVFDFLVPDDVAYADSGITIVPQPSALEDLTGVSTGELAELELAFWSDGELVLPWEGTLRVTRALCARHSHAVLEQLGIEESAVRRGLATGRVAWSDRRWGVDEVLTHDAGPTGRPARDLVRSWCDPLAAHEHDELVVLRHEVRRLGSLAVEAITLLRRSNRAQADRLARELGITV